MTNMYGKAVCHAGQHTMRYR